MNKTKKINRQNNLLDQQIREENQEIYGDMICYIRSADISDYEIEVIRQDLIEMILSAQSRGENITSLFTGDYKQFCDEVIAAIPPKTRKEKIVYALDTVFLCLSILIGINILISKDFIGIIKAVFTKVAVNWNISVSLGSLITMFVIISTAAIVVQMICKNSFSKKWNTLWIVAGAFAFGIVFTAISWIGRNIVFTVNFFVACAAAVLFFAIHKVLEIIDDPS